MSRTHTERFAAHFFLLRHALLIPIVLVIAAFAAQAHGIDRYVTDLFFDKAIADFPARRLPLVELVGHRIAKSAVIALWLTLLGAAVAACWLPHLAQYRRLLWTTVAAMAVGPVIVVALKSLNAHHCPWDLKEYGGYADFASAWFVPAAEAGRCFPSGHAAGGFSLLALYFALRASGRHRLERVALVVALVCGIAFSAVRIAQGAHFLSHNLWSAAVVWSTAAAFFVPLMKPAAARVAASPTAA